MIHKWKLQILGKTMNNNNNKWDFLENQERSISQQKQHRNPENKIWVFVIEKCYKINSKKIKRIAQSCIMINFLTKFFRKEMEMVSNDLE